MSPPRRRAVGRAKRPRRPRSYFNDHVVVVMPHLLPGAKRFFDVSYGVAYDDLDDMRKMSLDYLVLVELKELTPDVRDALKEKK